jgi:hypothetical protein
VFVEPTVLVQTELYHPALGPFDEHWRGRLVHAPHYYHPAVHEGLAWDGDVTPTARVLEAYARAAQALGLPLWVGEYGGPAGAEGFARYVRALEAMLDSRLWSGAWWSYDRSDGGFALLAADGSLKPALAEAWRRPRVQRVGGDPEEVRYDWDARTLALRFRTRRGVPATSIVWLGEWGGEGGVVVTSSDADDRWRYTLEAGGTVLVIESDPRVDEHHVVVREP